MTEFERKQGMLKAEFRRMKDVKANFTDVRPSAMEDFLGRGDRRSASVYNLACLGARRWNGLLVGLLLHGVMLLQNQT